MNAREISEHQILHLRIYLAHFINHLGSHADEIVGQRDELGETSELRSLLDAALRDMETSRVSFAAVLEHLGGPLTSHGSAAAHGHAHSHPSGVSSHHD